MCRSGRLNADKEDEEALISSHKVETKLEENQDGGFGEQKNII